MKLIKCEGHGKVFVADNDKVVSVVHLQNEALSLNGNDVLAFSGSLQYDIKFMKSAGILAGGLFNVKVGFFFFCLRFNSILDLFVHFRL